MRWMKGYKARGGDWIIYPSDFFGKRKEKENIRFEKSFEWGIAEVKSISDEWNEFYG